MKKLALYLGFCWMALLAGGASPTTAPSPAGKQTVRAAALGTVNDERFWTAICARFEAKTGIHVETVVSSNKDVIDNVFKKGGIDFITLQSSDAVMNLAADGWVIDPNPWAQADLVLVGPKNDPAHIRGSAGIVEALHKIFQSKSPLVIHGSLGADQAVRAIAEANRMEIPTDTTTVLLNDHQRQVFQAAVDKKAYTLIAGLPFRSGKVTDAGYSIMVEGDPRLFRPLVEAVANPAHFKDAHIAEARQFAAFLRSPETQSWIASFGKGKYSDQPLFHPVGGIK